MLIVGMCSAPLKIESSPRRGKPIPLQVSKIRNKIEQGTETYRMTPLANQIGLDRLATAKNASFSLSFCGAN